ncbi:MAG: abortive infection family protein [Isosphaeraceae bacterium]
MQFRRLFDVFSRRHHEDPKPVAPLTKEFRSRLIMFSTQSFGRRTPRSAFEKEFWDEIHEKLRYLVGRPLLGNQNPINMPSSYDDTVQFLMICNDIHVLDFIEYIFQTQDYDRYQATIQNDLIDGINDLLLVDDLPYALTSFVWGTRKEIFHGVEQDAEYLVSYPRVIRRDDQVTHVWSIEPALTLLREKQFTSANQEFLKALEDYRKGDYGDCLTKCGSAFESTMKLICARNQWQSPSDQARPLLLTILQHSSLEQNYFEQPLLNIATLRNKLSTAHGAGTQQRQPPQHVAKYAINATAAAILLLVEECT